MAETLEQLESEYATLGEQVAHLASEFESIALRAMELDIARERVTDEQLLSIVFGGDSFELRDEVETASLDASLRFLDQVTMLRTALAKVDPTDPDAGEFVEDDEA